MEELTFNLNTSHVSVIRDALEMQISHLEDQIKYESHILNDEEKERLQNCLKVRHEVLDPILRIAIKCEGVIYFKRD